MPWRSDEMALVWQQLRFEGAAVPDAERIAPAITAVRIERNDDSVLLRDLHAHFAFDVEPGNSVEIYA